MANSEKRSGRTGRQYKRAYLLGLRATARRDALAQWIEQLETRVMMSVNYSGGFADVSALTLNGPAVNVGNLLQLTDNTQDKVSSVFANTQQSITGFTAQFDFKLEGHWPLADGFTFVMQNSAVTALGLGGGDLGFGGGVANGINHSVAIKFDTFDSSGNGSGEGNNSTGLYVNGASPTSANSINLDGSGFDMRSYDLSRVNMTYDGVTLTVVIQDLVTNNSATQQYTVDIPAVIGSDSAWVGFTASSGALYSYQSIYNWQFTPQVILPPAPSAPASLNATHGNGQTGLSWSAASGASSYTVKYGTTDGGPYTQTITGITGTSTTVTGLTNGTPYYFIVEGVNLGGEGTASPQASDTPQIPAPGTPSGLNATAGNALVDLTWSAVAGASTYTIKYGTTDGGPYATLVSGLTGTSTSISGLTNSATYYFVISATNAGGESANASQTSATPLLPAPGATTGLTASSGSSQVSLSWQSATLAESYTIKYGTTSGGPYTDTITGITATNAIVTSLTDGTQYFFIVVGVNATGEGTASNQSSATPAFPAPDAPENLAGTPGNGHVDLTWDAVPGATSYNVKFGTANGGPYNITVTGIATNSTTVNALTNGVPYYFVVSAVNIGGEGANSTQTTVTPIIPLPSVPTGLNVTPGNAQANITWSTASGANTYTIKYGTTLGGPYTQTAAGLTGTSTTITGLTNNTTYYFVISATNGGGETANSAEASTTPFIPLPAAPAGINATPNNGQVLLAWNSVPTAASYNIKYGTTAGGPYTSTVSGVTNLNDTISGLTNGTIYYFVVSAVNGGGEGADSSEASATPFIPLPAAPIGLLTSSGDTHVDLSWNSVATATSYNIKYGTANGGPYTITVNNISGTSTTISGLTNGVAYYFVVSAVNGGGEGADSAQNSSVPLPPAPGAPTGMGATSGNGQVTINWTSVSGATSYDIKYGTTNGGPYTTTVSGILVPNNTITGLTNGTNYYFVVTAINIGGESANSSQVSATPVLPLPVAPAGLSVIAGNGQANLTWNTVATATTYNVKYATESGGPYTVISGIGGNSTVIPVLANDTTYYFVVTANNASGEGAASAEVSGTPTTSVDFSNGFGNVGNSLQVNGSAFLNSGKLWLTNNVPGALSSVFAKTRQEITNFTSHFDFQISGSWPLGDGFTFVIQNSDVAAMGNGGAGLGYGAPGAGLPGGIQNSIAIKFDVSDSQGEGTNSTGLYINGAAPTNVGAINLAGTGLDLRSYNPFRATIDYDGTTLTLTLKDLITDATATHTFAVDIPGIVGDTSAWVGFTASSGALLANQQILNWKFTPAPAPTAPEAPTGIIAAFNSGQVGLSWNPSAGATGYQVKYGTVDGGPYDTIVPAGTTNAIITGLTNGTPYYFVVSALTGALESANSSQVSATPAAAALPNAPTGLTAASGNAQVGLTWNPVAGAVSYTIKYGTTSGGPYTTTLNNILGAGTTVTGLTNSTPYYFVVTASSGAGESANSTQAATTPVAPVVPLDFSAGFDGAASLLQINGSGFINSNNLWLTNNVAGALSSIFAKAKQDITNFTTTFDFQTTGSWPLGDGFTFVIQNTSLLAIGSSGAGLGYGAPGAGLAGGIPNSIAIKFDLFDSQGEGNNSTGLYVGGAAPTNVGSVNLNGTGYDMRSYNPSRATLTYDGTTLTLVLKDLATNVTLTRTFAVDIPAMVGANSAWVGFTAASGALLANQVIQKWNFTSTPVVPTAPAAPTGVTATPASGQVAIQWTASSGATSYNVKYGAISGGPYTTTVPASGTSATITGLTDGTPYYFVVTAINGVGEGTGSAQATATPAAPTIPTAPTGLTATGGNTQVVLSWTPVVGAASYKVKYGTTNNGPYGTVINNVAAASTSVAGLTNGTAYYFVVTAVNVAGESISSSQVTATPSGSVVVFNYSTGFATAGSTILLNGNALISGSNLSLTNNSAARVSSAYNSVKRDITGFTTTFDFQIDGSWPLGDGFTFVMQNAGFNAIGQGGSGLGYGAYSTGGPGGIPLSVAIKFDFYDSFGEGTNSVGLYTNGASPTNVNSVNLNGSGFDLRSYNLSRATISYNGSVLTLVLKDLVTNATVTKTFTVDIPTIVGGNTAIVGFTASSGSLVSNQVIKNWKYTATPAVPATPATPTGLAATAGNHQIGLNWTPANGATSYNVKYGTTSGGPYTTTVNGLTGTSTTISGLTNGTTYYFVVSGVNGVGEGSNSSQISSAPVAASTPAAPTGLTATGSNGQAALSWSPSVGAISYNVKYGTTAGGPYASTVNVAGTSATIPGLTNGTPYYFIVTAVNGVGEGANSAQATATPSASSVTLNYTSFPNSTGLTLLGSAQIKNNRLLLTNDFSTLKGNAYFNTQQDVTGFTAEFDFKMDGTWPLGDGFVFMLQRAGLNATGMWGGGLGYGAEMTGGSGGIPNSIAIKFDVYDNQGEGTNSTGLYVNGAAPTNVGSINAGTNGFNLRSYNLVHTTISYVGNTLTVLMKDMITNATSTQTYTIDIPATIGGTTAWVGFSAASGHFSANSAIYNLKYTSTPNVPTAPAAPTGLTATPGVGEVALSWTASAGATSYNIKYGTTSGGPYGTTINNVAGTSTTIPGLTNGTNYYFIVTAVNGVGEGAATSQVAGTPFAASAPAAPTGLTATAGNTLATLAWTASPGAVSYNVKYGTVNGGPYGTTVNVPGNSASIPGLVNGTAYYFVVSAINGNGEGANSAQATASPSASTVTIDRSAGFPSATGLTLLGSAQINAGKLLLTNNNGSLKANAYFNTQQDVTGFTTTFDYKIDGTWPLGDGFTFVIQRAGLNATGAQGGGLGYGAEFSGGTGGIANSVAIKFDFYNNQGEGTNSTGLYVNGAAPTNIGSIDVGSGGFNMRSYNMTRATITYSGTTLTVLLKDLVTGAQTSQTYSINIPTTIGGTSAWVGFTAASGHFGANQAIYNWSYTTVPNVPTPPATPTGLTPTIANGQVGLSWAAVAGASSYTVRYGTTNGGPYDTTVANITGTGTIISGLTNNTTYYFTVAAVNAVGEGAASGQVSATPLAVALPVPTAPTGLTVAAGNAQVTLNWNPVAGATSYNVKYGTVSGGPYGGVVTGIAGVSTTVTGLTNETPYYFVVTAVNGSGESLNSAQMSATPTSASQTIGFSSGFATAAPSLQINGSAYISNGKLLLTQNNASQVSSVYAKAQQNVAAFTTQFDFQITGSWPLADGFTFVIQGTGLNAIGQSGGGLGYGATNIGPGISNSVAVKFDVYSNNGEGNNSTGLYVNGAAPTSAGSVNLGGTGYDMRSYNLSRATMVYDGTTLTVTLKDLVTGATATQAYTVDIPAFVGSNSAWVGFTGSTGSIVSNQTIANWVFASA